MGLVALLLCQPPLPGLAAPSEVPPPQRPVVVAEEPSPSPPEETSPPPSLPMPDGPLTIPYAPARHRVRGLRLLPTTGELEGLDEGAAPVRFRMLSTRIPMFRPDTSRGRVESLGPEQWADVACITTRNEAHLAVAVLCPDPSPNTPMVCLRQSAGAVVVSLDTDHERVGFRDFMYQKSVFTYTGAIVIDPEGREVGVEALRPSQVVDLVWKDSPSPQALIAVRIVRGPSR